MPTSIRAVVEKTQRPARKIAPPSANRVANLAGDPNDYAVEAVNQIEAKQAFKANVGVIKVADEMWDSLLSIQTDSHKR